MDKGERIGRGESKGKGMVNKVKRVAGFTEVEDAHSKFISTILTGMNHALPFAKIGAGDSGCDYILSVLFLLSSTC